MVTYRKSTLEIYLDKVDAALANFEKADVLLYLPGKKTYTYTLLEHFNALSHTTSMR
jgi:hypothetical protein